jgi:CubicO group peptidase (beta-lactamase class C family)
MTPITPPGARYAYWDSAMNQFANVLTRVAGEPLKALFKRRIADPIGMDPAAWDWMDFGTVDGLVVNGGAGWPNAWACIELHMRAEPCGKVVWFRNERPGFLRTCLDRGAELDGIGCHGSYLLAGSWHEAA